MSLSLLLLEPHLDSRDMYVDFLQREGFVVRTPPTIAEATALAPTVDALVTETRVEHVDDGFELVTALRHTPATRRLPIVLLTSSTFERDVARAEAAGCDLFVAKPCVPGDLASAVRRAIAWRRSGSPRMIKFTDPQSYRKSG